MRWFILLLAVVTTACVPRWRSGPRLLDHIVARSEMSFGTQGSVRVLSDGRVLVSDELALQVWMLDRDLSSGRVIADATPATDSLFSPGSYLRPWRGDSTLLVKSGLGTGVILDEQGRAARVVGFNSHWLDRGPVPMEITEGAISKSGHVLLLMQKPTPQRERDRIGTDSFFVVRTSFANLARRDTVGALTRDVFGHPQWVPVGDGVTMMADGTIAIVRTRGYRIEWIDTTGAKRSTPVPHHWTILTPNDKRQAIDSMRAALRHPGDLRMSAGEIPDTVPPITWIGTIRADADDRIWIEKVVVRTNPYRAPPRGIYDIVDRQGRVERRVSLPAGALVKAFAPGLIYYMLPEGSRYRLIMARTK